MAVTREHDAHPLEVGAHRHAGHLLRVLGLDRERLDLGDRAGQVVVAVEERDDPLAELGVQAGGGDQVGRGERPAALDVPAHGRLHAVAVAVVEVAQRDREHERPPGLEDVVGTGQVGLVHHDVEADLAQPGDGGRDHVEHAPAPPAGRRATGSRRPGGRAGRRRAARPDRAGRRRCESGARGSGPAIAPSSSATSAAVRPIGPSTENGSHGVSDGQSGTTPGVGRRPTRPFQAAGLRSDPPRSPPSASGTIRQARATAPPPLEPPAERAGVPRIAGGAEHRVERVRARAPLGRVGLADHDRAGLAQPGGQQRVLVGDVIAERRRAVGGAHTGRVDQVLVRDRQAVQRRQRPAGGAEAVGVPGGRERPVGRRA